MQKMKKFPVAVPAELHRKFKIKCAVENTTMADVVRRLLEREIETIRSVGPKPDDKRRSKQAERAA